MSAIFIDYLVERNTALREELANKGQMIVALEQIASARYSRIAELEIHLDRARSEVVRLQDEMETRK